jgi:hypothetical protein
MTDDRKSIPTVSVSYARNGTSTKANALGMRPMQERAYEKRGEQYLLIKSPPASGKSRALMFIALDKLQNQALKQAIIVVPEKTIGASFQDEPLSQFGFWTDWRVEPKWNLCNAPGSDNGGKVKSVGAFLESGGSVLVCTHATFRFAVDQFGVEAFDDRLIAIDEFHHVSANPDNKLGLHLTQFIARDRVHIVAMTGSYFRGDADAVLTPQDEAKFDTVTYTYYEQLNGYEYLSVPCGWNSSPMCFSQFSRVKSLLGRNCFQALNCAATPSGFRWRDGLPAGFREPMPVWLTFLWGGRLLGGSRPFRLPSLSLKAPLTGRRLRRSNRARAGWSGP